MTSEGPTKAALRVDSSFDLLSPDEPSPQPSKAHSPRKERPPEIVVSRFFLIDAPRREESSESPLSPGKYKR